MSCKESVLNSPTMYSIMERLAGKVFPESEEIQYRTMKEQLLKGLKDPFLVNECQEAGHVKSGDHCG